MKTFISVIIPLYNKDYSIRQTIQSVLNQSMPNFELIIIDDGSTDESSKIVQEFKDPRIRLFSQNNSGVSAARNRGIKESRYKWISFLDGDDWWDPSFLKTVTNYSNSYSNDFFCCQYVQVNRGKLKKLERFPQHSGIFDIKSYLFAIHSSSCLIEKNVFQKVGGFNEGLTHGEDTDMWIRIGLKYEMFYIDDILSYYNIGGNPKKRSIGKLPPFEKHGLSIIENYFIEKEEAWNSFLSKRKYKMIKYYLINSPLDKEAIKQVDFFNEIKDQRTLKLFRHLSYIFIIRNFVYVRPKNAVKQYSSFFQINKDNYRGTDLNGK